MKKHNNLSTRPKQTVAQADRNNSKVTTTITELTPISEPLKFSKDLYIKIDHATLFDNIAVIVGWSSEGVSLNIPDVIANESISRPDACFATGKAVNGFITVIRIYASTPTFLLDAEIEGESYNFQVRFGTTASELATALPCYMEFKNKLMPYFVQSRLLSQYLAGTCTPVSQAVRTTHASGHLDIVHAFPDYGFVAYGWALKSTNGSFWLLTETNEWFSLDDAMWFSRPDVAEVFADSFGARASEAGFFGCFKNLGTSSSGSIRLVSLSDKGLFSVHEMTSAIGPQTPLSYARWAFSLSIPSSRFFERMDLQDGALIDNLIAKNRANYPNAADIWQTKGMATRPEISVIVPLYGRSDFVEYQLTKFSQDVEFTNGKIELIYVVDDPLLVNGLQQTCHQLMELYKVPMKFVWGKINRGYSGANNLGIANSSADNIILLNSDVFPLEPGWAGKIAANLNSDNSIGAVGAKLLYADGSIQHLGMKFDFAPEWGVWLNKHPGQGLDISTHSSLLDVEAATGACLAVRRADMEILGGMDEGFLIGDFEDSDLCLKLRELRGRIVVNAETKLVHLERQSFNQLGSNDFRTNVVKYNAWRHSRIWAKKISALKEKQS